MSAPFFDPAVALRWMRGNQAAVDFLRLAFQAAHLWDDLVDRDQALDDDDINEGMFAALVLLPRNSFYRANFETLNSILANASTNWRVATALERAQGVASKRIAYVLRSAYADLVTHSALLLGGPIWARDVGVELRGLTEPWGEYLTNLAAERAARGG